MIADAFNTIFYEPLYNGLIFTLATFPWMDVGVAVILFTVVVKLILLPFSIKAVKTQQQIKKVQPEIDAIKDKYDDDKQKQAMEMMDLYSKYDIQPFSGFFLILIQLPIIFALYYVFLRGGLPDVDPEYLYSFVSAPESISTTFFGVDVTKKSWVLALLAGATQFVQTKLSFGKNDDNEDEEATDDGSDRFLDGSFKEQFKQGLSMQMKYVFPIIVVVISYTLTAVIALYWTTSNLFHILQELYVQKMVLPHQDDISIDRDVNENTDSPIQETQS